MNDLYLMAIRDNFRGINNVYEVSGDKLLEALTEYFHMNLEQLGIEVIYTIED